MVQHINHLVGAMLVECDLHLQFWPSAVLAAVRAHPQPCAVQGMELP
jgi:hypothetical protein